MLNACVNMFIISFLQVHMECNRFEFRVFLLLDYHTKVKKPSLPYYLPITEERIAGFTLFQGVLAQCEMPRTSSRI